MLYTDGITKAFDRERVQDGLKRLCEAIGCNCALSAEGIRQAVIEDVPRHIGQPKIFDALILVVLKQK